MGARKNGACKSEQRDPVVEPDMDKDPTLGVDLNIDLDSEPDFDSDDDLDIELDLDDDSDADLDTDDTVKTGEASSNVGETSVEIDVEELIAELEADRDTPPRSEGQSCRKRLEDVLEERRIAHELDDIDDIDEFDSIENE